MRSSRPTLFLSTAAGLALLATACGGGEGVLVADGLELSKAIGAGGGASAGTIDLDSNDLALRAQGDSGSSAPGSISGAGGSTAEPSGVASSDGPSTAEPGAGGQLSPPTLSPSASEAATTTSAPQPASTAPPASSDTASPATTQATTAPASTAEESPVTTAASATVQPASTTDTTGAPAPGGADASTGEGRSFSRLNELRAGLGLGALTRDGEMDAFARDWSRQMAQSGDFRHSSGPYGENIAFTSNTTLSAAEAADLFHQLWLDSPGHYANMTNGGYAKAGIGLFLTDRGWYGTHVFAF